jgi:hypothetical protein
VIVYTGERNLEKIEDRPRGVSLQWVTVGGWWESSRVSNSEAIGIFQESQRSHEVSVATVQN